MTLGTGTLLAVTSEYSRGLYSLELALVSVGEFVEEFLDFNLLLSEGLDEGCNTTKLYGANLSDLIAAATACRSIAGQLGSWESGLFS